MSNLEDIGRYHQCRDQLDAALADRNDVLLRVDGLAKAAAEPPASRYNIGRRARLDGLSRLVEEAGRHDAEVLRLLAELEQLAPLVGKPAPTLE